MSEEPVIQTRNLTKKYGEFLALDELSIHLDRGQILGFIGPNGAGKTTTIKILVGLAKPTSGSATITGVDCTAGAKKIKHLVGYMPDMFGAYDNMRVHEYLDFFGAAFKIPRGARLKRIEEVMETTGSRYMRDFYVQSLSHGMKQRVAIARTLLHDPPVMIFDEPANGLDPEARVEMRQILLALAARGKTLIVTSHILPELARICDIVAIITGGRLRAFGPLQQIMQEVHERRTVEVQLLSNQATHSAAEIVRKALGAEANINEMEAEAMVRFTSGCDDKMLSHILQLLVENRVGVSQFREVQRDLEDAFLSIARKDQAREERIDASAMKPAPALGGAPG